MRFGPFCLDYDNLQLAKNGRPIPLTPKAMDVMCELTAQAGKLVHKRDLLAAVWDDVLASDASLVVCIREIRRALDDSAEHPRFIETVHRRGYRFIGEINKDPSVSAPWAKGVSHTTPFSTTPVREGCVPVAEPLVGRDREIELLRERLDDAMRSVRQIALVIGEAGAGKSVLVDCVAQMASRLGFHVGIGRCFERFGTGEPFLPILDALNQLAKGPASDALSRRLRSHAPTWLLQMPWLIHGGVPALRPEELLGATPQRMLREFSELIEVVSKDFPILLVLEDLHWSDHSTVDVLAHFSQRSQPVPVAILATLRLPEAPTRKHPIFQLAASLRRSQRCFELPLPPLDHQAVMELLRRRWPSRDPDANTARVVLKRSGGHPFFVTHLIAAIPDQQISHGGTDVDPGRSPIPQVTHGPEIPHQIRESIEELVSQIPADDQHLLEYASVAGNEFSTALLAAATCRDAESVEQVCEGLRQTPPLLEFVGTSPLPDGNVTSCYRFRHVLYQEVLYNRLSTGRRARIHRQMGLLLESPDLSAVTDDKSAELAWHFQNAMDSPRAIQYLRRAAQRAATRFARREAIDYLNSALAIAAETQEPCPRTQIDLLESRGLTRRAGNEMAQAAEDFRAAADMARAVGDFARETQARFHCASALSWLNRDQCLAASEQAVEASQKSGNSGLIIQARGFAGDWYDLWQGWRAVDAHATRAAVQAARASAHQQALAKHLAHLSWFASLSADYEDAFRAADEAGRLAMEFGDNSDYMLSVFYQAWALLHLARFDDTRQILNGGLEISERNEHQRWSLLFRLLLAWIDLCEENYEVARTALVQVWQDATQLSLPLAEMASRILRAQAELAIGDGASAAQLLTQVEQSLQSSRVIMDWTWRMMLCAGQAGCCLASRDFAQAIAYAQEMIQLAETCGEATRIVEGYSLIARAAEACGDSDAYHHASERIRITLAKKPVPWANLRQ